MHVMLETEQLLLFNLSRELFRFSFSFIHLPQLGFPSRDAWKTSELQNVLRRMETLQLAEAEI